MSFPIVMNLEVIAFKLLLASDRDVFFISLKSHLKSYIQSLKYI